MESHSYDGASPGVDLHWQLINAFDIYNSIRYFTSTERCSPLRTDDIHRIASSYLWPESFLEHDPTLNWLAELEARAAARAHFWPAEEDQPMRHVSPPTATFASHHLVIVTRSQILRTFERLSPEAVEEYREETGQMIRRWQAGNPAVPYLIHPESATGTLRPLRPPGIEEESIRAPPHCPEGPHAEAYSAEGQHECFSSGAVVGAGTTDKEWNKIHTFTSSLFCWTLRVLKHGLHLFDIRSLPAKDKFMSFCVSGLLKNVPQSHATSSTRSDRGAKRRCKKHSSCE